MQKSMSRKIDRHGVVIKGLKKASGNTVDWPINSGGYTEVFYDTSTGKVWTVDQVSFGHNSCSVYDDDNIIGICETERHMTMQQIADAIYEELSSGDYGNRKDK